MNRYTKFNQKGKGLYNYFKGAQFQRGFGFFSQVKKFFNWAWPLIKQHAAPKLEAGLKTVGNEAITSLSNIAKDVVAGKDVVDSTKYHVDASINKLKELAENNLSETNKSGRGIKRKKKRKTIILFKKRKKPDDIFS